MADRSLRKPEDKHISQSRREIGSKKAHKRLVHDKIQYHLGLITCKCSNISLFIKILDTY